MKIKGFTLIEILVFLIVSSLLMSVILLGANAALRTSPSTHRQWVAIQTAQRCMEWFINQSRMNGYGSITCPSTALPGACASPSGYAVASNVACTTWNGDANYKTITVTVSGLASTSLTAQIGEF